MIPCIRAKFCERKEDPRRIRSTVVPNTGITYCEFQTHLSIRFFMLLIWCCILSIISCLQCGKIECTEIFIKGHWLASRCLHEKFYATK